MSADPLGVMTQKAKRSTKAVKAYAAIVLLAFLFVTLVLQLREFGLYLVLGAINLPASLAVLPLSEKVAPYVGWSLGSWQHVVSIQIVCVIVNALLLASIVRVASRGSPK